MAKNATAQQNKRRRARETLDAKGRGPTNQDKKGYEVKGRPHQDSEIAPAVRIIVAPGVACTVKVEYLPVEIVGEHKTDK